jgi:trehalose 6-phosphate phosphatase
MVALENLVYAGSHGFDIAGSDELKLQHDQAQDCLPDLDAAERDLHVRLGAIKGVLIERKHFAVAIHYRLAAESDVDAIAAAVGDVRQQHPSLRQKGGKKIFELQPDVPWHKGRAVLWLRQVLGLDRADVVTIYIGDDETDEDAFHALAEQQAGLGIIVGPNKSTTQARFYLDDCSATEQFLELLLNLPSSARKN